MGKEDATQFVSYHLENFDSYKLKPGPRTSPVNTTNSKAPQARRARLLWNSQADQHSQLLAMR